MKLTISMAVYDDYDGVYFTVQALRLYQELPAGTEILILDNNPAGPCAAALKKLVTDIPECRLLAVENRKSSFVKYDVFHHARGDVVLGLDCHVLLAPGFVPRLMSHWQARPDSRDMITGPVIFNDLKARSSHMRPDWRGHDYGCWSHDLEALSKGEPFEVPMQGMACFSIRREAWQGIHPGFKGFGAEEWYVAEKVRQWGGRVLCDPALAWAHRFGWPRRTFPLTLEAKVLNYYRGWLELYGGHDHPMMKEMKAHWLTQMPAERLEKMIQKADMERQENR